MKSRFVAAMDLLQEEASRGDLTLRRLFDLLGEEGHAMLMLFLCLPFLQPIPMPGLSTPLGLLIAVVAIFLHLERAPWLPKKYESLTISREVVLKVSNIAEKIWLKVSKIIRTRMTMLHDHPVFRILNLCVLVGNGLLLALPLPIPFSNTFPTIAIILSIVGHLEKDGLFILFSYFWCFLVMAFFGSILAGAMYLV